MQLRLPFDHPKWGFSVVLTHIKWSPKILYSSLALFWKRWWQIRVPNGKKKFTHKHLIVVSQHFGGQDTYHGTICTSAVWLRFGRDGLWWWSSKKAYWIKLGKKMNISDVKLQYLSLMINVIKVLSYFGGRRLTLNVRHNMAWQSYM